MKDISYIFRMNWIKVPQFLYNILLFGGFVLVPISLVFLIFGLVRKKNKQYFKVWLIILIIAIIVVLLTATGKIAGHMMFGG